MLKKLFVSTFGLMFATWAAANGPYDGIYNVSGTQEYLSVHQNGSGLIVGYFTTIPASNMTFLLGDGQSFAPNRVDYWDLLSGTISGNYAPVNGEVAYGACRSYWDVVFSGSSVTVTQTYIDTTTLGFNRGINCPAYQDFLISTRGYNRTYQKVY